MVQLIVGLVILVIVAAIGQLGASHIPTAFIATRRIDAMVVAGMDQLAARWDSRISGGDRRLPTADGIDAEGELPASPTGTAWSFGTAPGSRYVCLSGTVGEVVLKGMEQAARRYPQSAFVIGVACGAASGAAVPPPYPAQVAATLWISRP